MIAERAHTLGLLDHCLCLSDPGRLPGELWVTAEGPQNGVSPMGEDRRPGNEGTQGVSRPLAERRKEPRRNVKLSFRPEAPGRSVEIAVTRDISLSGLCLEMGQPLLIGHEAVITLSLPGFRLPLVLLSVVRWTSKEGLAGVQFMRPRAYDVWALQRFLSRIS